MAATGLPPWITTDERTRDEAEAQWEAFLEATDADPDADNIDDLYATWQQEMQDDYDEWRIERYLDSLEEDPGDFDDRY